ncbi:hypothetical protein [Massilia sp. TS11]|uniref:hypothetical protein n=1 Tax=Massilia sp. TS11 TaxID=2908003 RepID=UPI001EDB10B5|nr:hypothetical protein [Massilia sp. TS11]MCG2583672.1 hypothetical protein [Massilia sp. TS11]
MQAHTLPLTASGEGASWADSVRSGVAWGAIFAGAAAAGALSLILFMLGIGLGLSTVSPFAISTQPIGWSSIGWIALTELLASGVGGYMAGRLHTRWNSTSRDEAGFRDMAHGMLAWAVASLMMAALLASSVRAVASGAVDIASNTAANAGAPNLTEYYADMMLRGGNPGDAAGAGLRNEVGKILLANARSNSMAAEDRAYLLRMVMARSGANEADAGARVDAVYTRFERATAEAQAQAREAADRARRAAAYSALWMVAALVLGALTASVCAGLAGRGRARERTPEDSGLP